MSDDAQRLDALSWAFARFFEKHAGVLANLPGWDEMSLAFHANCSQEPERISARSETTRSEGYPGIAHDLESMRTALTNLLVQYEGVYDCVDNDGKRYQSQGAADAEVAARKALKDAAP